MQPELSDKPRFGLRDITRREVLAGAVAAVNDGQIVAAGAGFRRLGVAVLKGPAAAGLPLGAGSWNWTGVYGANFWVDPAVALSAVVLTNTAVAGMTGAFPATLRRAAYPA